MTGCCILITDTVAQYHHVDKYGNIVCILGFSYVFGEKRLRSNRWPLYLKRTLILQLLHTVTSTYTQLPSLTCTCVHSCAPTFTYTHLPSLVRTNLHLMHYLYTLTFTHMLLPSIICTYLDSYALRLWVIRTYLHSYVPSSPPLKRIYLHLYALIFTHTSLPPLLRS